MTTFGQTFDCTALSDCPPKCAYRPEGFFPKIHRHCAIDGCILPASRTVKGDGWEHGAQCAKCGILVHELCAITIDQEKYCRACADEIAEAGQAEELVFTRLEHALEDVKDSRKGSDGSEDPERLRSLLRAIWFEVTGYQAELHG